MRGFNGWVSAVVLVVALAPAAAGAATEPEGLTFVPDLASPGDLVTVRTSACGAAASGMVYAKSLGGNVWLRPALKPGVAEGQFRVLGSADPGRHTILGVCADGTHVGGVLKVPRSWVG
jgi:hypothetical protein